MTKRVTSSMLASLTLWTSLAAAQDPAPTVVRKVDLDCTTCYPTCESEEHEKKGGQCLAPEGTVKTLDRPELNAANFAVRDRKRCKKDLAACLDRTPPPPVEQGWAGWEVGLLVAGVAVGAVAFGAGLGYGLAKLEQAGRI